MGSSIGTSLQSVLEEKRLSGNLLFKSGRYAEAIEVYRKVCADNSEFIPVFYINIISCYSKMGEWTLVLDWCNEYLSRLGEGDFTHEKVVYQRALSLYHLCDYEEAICFLDVEINKLVILDDPLYSASISLFKSLKQECVSKHRREKFNKVMESVYISVNDTFISKLQIPSKMQHLDIDCIEDINLDYISRVKYLYQTGKTLPIKCLFRIISYARDTFSKEKSLNRIYLKKEQFITICGDVHGQFSDLLDIFTLFGSPSEGSGEVYGHLYLFNGDFVDRGPKSVEVMVILLLYKIIYPRLFHLSRGNHETKSMSTVYGFKKELDSKYADPICVDGEVVNDHRGLLFGEFLKLFGSLPLCHVVQDKIFVVHGGIPREPDTRLLDIEKIDRMNASTEDNEIMCDLLWADPSDAEGIGRNSRGTSVTFGKDITRTFLQCNSLDMVVRSHEHQQNGYKMHHDGNLVTVFSAPNYMSGNNCGAVMHVQSNGTFKFEKFRDSKIL